MEIRSDDSVRAMSVLLMVLRTIHDVDIGTIDTWKIGLLCPEHTHRKHFSVHDTIDVRVHESSVLAGIETFRGRRCRRRRRCGYHRRRGTMPDRRRFTRTTR